MNSDQVTLLCRPALQIKSLAQLQLYYYNLMHMCHIQNVQNVSLTTGFSFFGGMPAYKQNPPGV